ncbi:MAG: general secretion pathway protein GspF [Gammaproteobacteria bacterium]|nr:general secretion pathway protein GspF [Gammaproteobacteria bacterium]
MSKKRQPLHPDAPLLHPDHPRPVTRRQFLRQGFIKGGALVTGPALLNLFLHSEEVKALTNAPDLTDTNLIGTTCLGNLAGNTVPFICFDLSGGANLAASNVLVGQQSTGDGQIAFLSTTGYSRMGLPATKIPSANPAFINNTLGLKFHSESAMLAGILDRFKTNRTNVDGVVFPARSENDTGNNPHNPLYGIAHIGAKGRVSTLIGSVNSDSGGNSLAPTMFMDPSLRPTKVDRPSDVVGLVDTGDLTSVLSQADAVNVMKAVARISKAKVAGINTGLSVSAEDQIKKLVNCGYVKAADIAESFGSPDAINPATDPDIVGTTGIFSTAEFNADSEFRKTASVMKMVLNSERLAGAGCITMGGYDYHTGDRITGERRDLRAGRCIGACLEYAARKNSPLMIYVFSDGSVFSDGTIDNTALTDGAVSVPGGKGVWTGDSSTTASSFILVYNPGSKPALLNGDASRQIGYFRADGSVETNATPGANNVNLLVQTVWLNYMALHSSMNGQFSTLFPGHGLGTGLNALTAFNSIV